jgi:pimeloyl-ACP methyl ester carboxylesterase
MRVKEIFGIALLFMFLSVSATSAQVVSTSTGSVASTTMPISTETIFIDPTETKPEVIVPVKKQEVLIDTQEDKKEFKKFNIKENNLFRKDGEIDGVDKNDSKNFFKIKKENKNKVDIKKLKTKLEKIKNRKFSSSLQTSLNNLKTKKKGLKSEKDQAKVIESLKGDFESLKQLNKKIQDETSADFKSNLTIDEQDVVDNIDANIIFQSDDIFIPNDISSNIIGSSDWAISAILSENSNIFSTLQTLNRPVLVAVIDSGIEFSHEEIKDNMWKSTTCVDENNAQIVGGCTNGYDFVDNDKDPSPTDGFDHGTAVATLIAGATDNGKGISSLSQNRAKIMALRVADNGYIELNNIVRAVYFAVNNGADIINMSLSGPTYSQSLYDALQYANTRGVKVVVSSGNQGLDLEVTKVYPASLDLGNIYVVGSLDNNGAISSFSNYGIKTVDVLAPGRNVMTGSTGNTYSPHSGTSFSAPIFASLLARWISEGKDIGQEVLRLNSNSTFQQKVIGGKTLAFSGVLDAVAVPSVLQYKLLPNGTYLDTFSKGGNILTTLPTTLQYQTADGKGATSGLTTFARQISPGSTDVNNPPTITTTNTTLVWSPATGAKITGVYYKDLTANSATVIVEPISGTSYNISGLIPGHIYIWNTGVSSKTTTGPISDYNLTQVYAFKVSGGVSVPTTPTSLSPFYNSSPGQSITGSSYSVSWGAVSGATSYKLINYISTGGSQTQTLTTNSGTIAVTSGYNYRYTVQACNSSGCSPESSPSYFNTVTTAVNQSPSSPTISGPTSGSANTSLSFTFKSIDPESENVLYEIIWDNDFSSNTVQTSYTTQNTNYSQTKSFANIKNTCVRARARDTYGNYSAYSSCYNINIIGVTKPDLLISSIPVTNGTFAPGASFLQTINIVNQGNLATANGYHVSVYLNNSVLVGQYTRTTAQSVGVTDTQNINIALPASGNNVYTNSGSYNLTFKVDDLNQVDESNENNEFNTGIIINLPVIGKTFSVNNLANQTQNSLFTFTINQSGYAAGTSFVVTADNNSTNQSTFTLSGAASQSFNLKLSKANTAQTLKFVVNNSQTINSNTFVVSPDTSVVTPLVSNAGNITITVRDLANQVVSGASVDVCSVLCDNSKVTKTTDTNGNVIFTKSDFGSLLGISMICSKKGDAASSCLQVTYDSVSPNTYSIKTPLTYDNLHYPIILIPGISGSTLGNDNLVIPVINKETYPDISKLKIADGTGEYGFIGNIYPINLGNLGWEKLRKNLESVGYVRDQTIIDCPYDWRQSNDATADIYFAGCVERALKASGKDKVDVIAHSMGGLVTRAYIQKNNGANANKIRKIAFVGTPQEGASVAYKVWEGGDPADSLRELIIARAMQQIEGDNSLASSKSILNAIIKIPAATGEFLGFRDTSKNNKIATKIFIQKYALALKQLLPTYDFLNSNGQKNIDGTYVTDTKLSNNNQNEFLLALNSLPCGDICDDGKNGGGIYNYKNFTQTISGAGIVTKMFYGQKYNADGTVVASTDFQYHVDTVNKGIYNDGAVIETDIYKTGGDVTVPTKSTKSFSGSYTDGTTDIGADHAFLPGAFAQNITQWISGQLVPATLQATDPTSHLNITLGAGVSAYLVGPNGKTLGINPVGNISENTIGSDAKATIDGSGVTFSLDNPTIGNYKLYIEGNTKTNYSFYSELSDATHRDVVMGTRIHQGTEEILNFSLSGTTDPNVKGLQYQKIESVPQNIVVSNNGGNTKISFTQLLDTSIIKYKIYSKLPAENDFVQIGETTVNTFDTTNPFAGANENLTRDYRISSVYSDGTESNLSLDYFNNDSDWDGLTDTQEVQYTTIASKTDTDGDGLPDGVEINIIGTDPTKVDTNNNGIDDYTENKIKYNLKDKVVTTSGPTPLAHYKFDGAIADPSKYKDVIRPTASLMQSGTSISSTADRKNTADSAISIVPNTFFNFDTPKVLTNNPITYSYWVKTSQTGFARMFSMNANGSRNFLDINLDQGKVLVEIGSTGSINTGGYGTAVINNNLWHKIDLTLENSPNAIIKIYVDGLLNTTINGTIPYNVTGLTNKINLAACNNWGNSLQYLSFFNGTLDDVKVFDKALSQSEITSTFNSDMGIIAVNATPTLTLLGDNPQIVFKNATWTDLFATATDTEDGVLTNSITRVGTVDTTKTGTTTITYSVTDSGGQTVSKNKIVNVIPDPANLYLLTNYKLDGSVASSSKYKNETSDTKPLVEILKNLNDPAASVANRFNNLDTALDNRGFSTYEFDSPTNVGNQAVTFSTWFKTSNIGSAQTIFGMGSTNTGESIQVGTKLGYVWADLNWISDTPAINKYLTYNGNYILANNSWHKMDVVINNSPNATIKVYTDGALEKVVTDTLPYNFKNLRSKMHLGTIANSGTNMGYQLPYWGILDDVKIYDKELSASEITAEYQKDMTAPVASSTPGILTPVNYFKVNGILGSATKKLDEINATNQITNEQNVITGNGRDGGTDGSYNFASNGAVEFNQKNTPTNNAMTYSLWVKSNIQVNSSILGVNATGGPRSFFTIWETGGKVFPELAWPGYGMGPSTAVKNIIDNKWHKIDITMENSPNAILKSYVDGVLESTTNFAVPYNMANMSKNVVLGGLRDYSNNNIGSPFRGLIDEIRIFDKVLSQTEITSLFTAENANTTLSILQLNSLGEETEPEIIIIPDIPNTMSSTTEPIVPAIIPEALPANQTN